MVSDHFWKLRRWKKCTVMWREAHSKSKCTKCFSSRLCLAVEMFKICTPLWREAHVEVKMFQTVHVRSGSRKGVCTLPKMSKAWRFYSSSSDVGRRGTFEEDPQRCMSRSRRNTRDTWFRHVRRSGRWFPEMGCIFEHQIFRFAKVILGDRCSTSYDLASLSWQAHFFRQMELKSQYTLVRGCQLCTQLFIFEGSLANLLRFWCCQLRKLGASQRTPSFLTLSNSKIEEVSQNSCVFQRADR